MSGVKLIVRRTLAVPDLRAVAIENATVDRTARVLEAWAAAEPGTPDEGLTVKQEIKAIQDAMKQKDWEFFARYGGRGPAMKRAAALINMPQANVTEGDRMVLAPGLQGGGGARFRLKVGHSHIPLSLSFRCGYPL